LYRHSIAAVLAFLTAERCSKNLSAGEAANCCLEKAAPAYFNVPKSDETVEKLGSEWLFSFRDNHDLC
jgi:hypothetical protein